MKNSINQQTLSLLIRNLLLITIFFIGLTVLAQTENSVTKITGEVLGVGKNELPQVSVILKGTKYGTITNSEGVYSLSVPNGSYTIVASYLGYAKQTKKIVVKGKAIVVNFNLKEIDESLKEVVVNAKNPEAIVLESKSAAKSNMSLMNTPAPIVAVNRGVLDQQGITTLQEAIRNISGVTQAGNNYNIGDFIAIRGLDANFTLDGMYSGAGTGNSYNPTRSLTNVERVEVLKGPVTGLYGMGSAGGVINFIEKKPEFTEKGLAEVSFGQWNSFRAMVDYTAPISDKFAFRIVSATSGQEGYRDVSSEVFESYGALTFKSGIHNLTLSGAAIHDAYDIDAIGDPIRYIEPGLLDNFDWTTIVNDDNTNPNTGEYYGLQLTDEQRQTLANSLNSDDGISPFDIGDHSLITGIADPNEGKEYRVKLRYDLNPMENFTITNQFLYRTYSSEFTRATAALNYIYTDNSQSVEFDANGDGIIDEEDPLESYSLAIVHLDPRAPLIEDGVIYPYAARRTEYRHQEVNEKAFQYFGDFKYDWSLGSVKGEHLLSLNYENRSWDYGSWSIYDADDARISSDGAVPYIYDITNEEEVKSITGNFWDFDVVDSRTSLYNKTVAAYGIGFQEVLYLIENKLTARLGGAYSNVTQEFEDVDAETPVYDFDDAGFNYNLGVTFRPIEQLSVFGNYSKGRTAYSLTGSISEDYDREDSESKSIDIGIRFKTKNNSLLASIVAFQTARTNLQYANDEYDEILNPNVPENFYDREERFKGLELDVNYYLTKKLSFNFNGTIQDPIVIEGGEEDEGSYDGVAEGLPKKYARFWTEYKHFFKNSNNPLLFNFGVRYEDEKFVDGYGLAGIIPSYVVCDAGLGYNLNNKWNFRLNVNNLFNEDYYSKAMFAGGLPGEPTNFQFTVQYKF